MHAEPVQVTAFSNHTCYEPLFIKFSAKRQKHVSIAQVEAMLQQYAEPEPALIRAEASGVPSIPGSFSMPASPRSPMGVLSRGSSGIR